MRLFAVLAAVHAVAASSGVQAQSFTPSRPVEVVVHGGPGSGNDVFGRMIVTVIEQEKLAPVRFQISNRPGGGSTTASAYLSGKAGDTHVIGVYTNTWLTDPLVQEEAKVNLHKDLTPIARVVAEPALFVVRTEAPFKTLADFITAAKEKPGALKQSGGSITARENVTRQIIQKQTGANWAYISFPSGGERLSALLGGHVDIMMIDPGEGIQQVRAGKLRVLAQLAESRLPGFPDVPTVKEAGFELPKVPQVRGVVGVPNMPKEAVAYYEALIEKVATSAPWKKFLEDNYFEWAFAKSAETKAFLAEFENDIREQMRMTGAKLVR